LEQIKQQQALTSGKSKLSKAVGKLNSISALSLLSKSKKKNNLSKIMALGLAKSTKNAAYKNKEVTHKHLAMGFNDPERQPTSKTLVLDEKSPSNSKDNQGKIRLKN
jgi:hypothetical protein